MLEALVQSARRAHRAAISGELSGLGPTVRVLEASSHPVARAWAAALRTELWLAEPRYGLRVPAAWLSDFVDGPPLARAGAVIALGNAARSAVIDFDGDALAALEPLGTELAHGLDDEAALTAELVSAWAALASGNAARSSEVASEIGRRAARAKLSALVVEAQALRSLACGGLGQHDQALELSRRASLMARSEGLPQPEFFAHFALVRARRHARQPHLALRILEALSGVLPRCWQAWLGWELLLARGRAADGDPALQLPESKARGAVRAARAVLDAAARGDREGFPKSGAELERSTQSFAPAHAESLELLALIDPSIAAPSAELADWRNDASVLLPAAMDGFRARTNDDDESAAAYVLLRPGERGRRLLHTGLALVSSGEVARIRQSQRAQGRVETLLAILALAGPQGLDEAVCFARTYGFELVPELHRGVFDVLLHRARAALGSLAQIERRDRNVLLEPAQPLLVPDPRVSQRTTDRVLRLLAERGTASAKDAAALLGISLRSAQAALSELATCGACDARKQGKSVAYVVEDTIFSEPSRRLSASDLTGLTSLGA
jgi:hypothetical protein